MSMLEIDRRGQPGFGRVFNPSPFGRADVFAQDMPRSHDLTVGGTSSAPEGILSKDRLPILTEEQTELLVMLGYGLSYKEIAKRLFFAEMTIKIRCSLLYRTLRVKNRTQAVVTGIALGLVTAEDMLPENFDPKKLTKTPTNLPEEKKPLFDDGQRATLRSMGMGLTAEEIGNKLGYTEAAIKARCKVIYKILRTKGQPVHTRLGAVLATINLGEITPEEMIEDGFYFKYFESLTETQWNVLKAIAEEAAIHFAVSPSRALAQTHNIPFNTVKYHLSSIFEKLGTGDITHAVVLFLAYKRRKKIN